LRAIIHSIHSQVPKSIADLRRHLDAVVSLDSHLDVSLGGDDHIYPKELQMIARRTGAHTAIRQLFGPRPPSKTRVIVAIPEMMLVRHAEDTESNLPRNLRVHDRDSSVASVVEFLRSHRGIEIFQSPPESLFDLSPTSRTQGAWLLDIDVDYMQEMQKECYTRIINPKPGVLQSMSQVLEFVRRSKPEIITLSEAKVSAIQDEKSTFSGFVTELKSMGYSIEDGEIAATDAEVIRGIAVCKEFYRTVSKTLMLRHMDEMMKGEFESFRREEESVARKFFSSKGYKY
jgi:hypothetical protein